MNASRPGELRELLGRLSDGTLSVEEADRLTELLKADPIAQEQYLDHMLVDGLLEREFGGAAQTSKKWGTAGGSVVAAEERSAPARFNWMTRSLLTGWAFVPVAAMVTIAVNWVWWGVGAVKPPLQLNLADSGFESGAVMPAGTPLNAAWFGDKAEIVGRYSDVFPLEGGRMLRFVKSTVGPEDTCELYQIVDLRRAAKAIAGRPMTIEASAFFNSIQDDLQDGHCTFEITVFAFSADPSLQPHVRHLRREQALAFGGSQTRADVDSLSWQQVMMRLRLPADAKYLLVQIAAIHPDLDESSKEFPGHFADNVELNLVSN